MKKIIMILFLTSASLLSANEAEVRGEDLCSFTEEVFGTLHSEYSFVNQETIENALVASINRLKAYEDDPNPEIATLAEKFILSFSPGVDTSETLADAVSSLGRLLKRSVDDDYYRLDTPYIIHKDEIQTLIAKVESQLGERLPHSNVNYHKLMIESLAEEEYDLALYAYLKIAESRCH